MSSSKTVPSNKRTRGPKETIFSKKKRDFHEDSEEEQRLTAMLFGGNKEQIEHHSSDDEAEESGDEDDFVIDTKGENQSLEDSDDVQQLPTAAWEDEDDVGVDLQQTHRLAKLRKSKSEDPVISKQSEFERRLRMRYENTAQLSARTDWANLEQHEEAPEDDVPDTAQPLLANHFNDLPKTIIKMQRCRDANQDDPNRATVQAVQFHPASDPDRPLLLTAGFDKTLRFFQVAEEKSTKVHGIHCKYHIFPTNLSLELSVPKLPIYSACFLGTSGNVVVSGRRSFFYVYDAVAGKLDNIPRIIGREEKSLEKCTASPDGRTVAFIGNDGYIILYDTHNKRWIANLKMNGSTRSICFSPDGEEISASGSDGDVYTWNVKSRRFLNRFVNNDGSIVCSLARSSRHIAVGAESGVVNMFETVQGNPMRNQTRKSIMNLQTSADMVRFNHDGQILALSSRREKMGLKLVHVPSQSVFANWPTSNTPLHYVWATDFSPQSKFVAIGNDKGKCLLYKLGHYNQ